MNHGRRALDDDALNREVLPIPPANLGLKRDPKLMFPVTRPLQHPRTALATNLDLAFEYK